MTQSLAGLIPRTQAIVWSSIAPLVCKGKFPAQDLFCGPEQTLARQHGLVTQTTSVWRHWVPSWQTRPHSGSPQFSPGLQGYIYENILLGIMSECKDISRQRYMVCSHVNSDHRMDLQTLRPKRFYFPDNIMYTVGKGSTTSRNLLMVTFHHKAIYLFTWSTLSLADHTDIGGRGAGSLEKCFILNDIALTLISSQRLTFVQWKKTNECWDRNFKKLTTLSWHSYFGARKPMNIFWDRNFNKTYNLKMAQIAVSVSIRAAHRVIICCTHLRACWQWFVSKWELLERSLKL